MTTQTNEQLEVIFTEQRKKIDTLFNMLKATTPSSANLQKSINHLQMAKGWIGKAKGSLGITSPYTPAEKVADIPPTADTSTTAPVDGKLAASMDKLALINSVRDSLATLVKDFKPGNINPDWEKLGFDSFMAMQLSAAVINLEEGSMWLGFELSDMRDAANDNELYKQG